MPFIVQTPIINTADEQRRKKIENYLPGYITQIQRIHCNKFSYYFLRVMQYCIQGFIKLILRPRTDPVGDLDIHEVEDVYNREAKTYDFKHHMTTRGMDTVWRRFAAWCAISYKLNNQNSIKLLDLCTGTGLTIQEMIPLFELWNMKAKIYGLDYNARMLSVAKKRNLSGKNIDVHFVRGDAMNLVKTNKETASLELIKFDPNSFEVITQMFGIGGIAEPVLVFEDVLQLLKPGGRYFLIDMHQPIINQPGELPIGIKWCKSPALEVMTYQETTIPLALHRLWGWRDTTLDFYLLPLITSIENGHYWGFKIINFEVESQRWWFGLPVMPVGKIIVEKSEISQEERLERNRKLKLLI